MCVRRGPWWVWLFVWVLLVPLGCPTPKPVIEGEAATDGSVADVTPPEPRGGDTLVDVAPDVPGTQEGNNPDKAAPETRPDTPTPTYKPTLTNVGSAGLSGPLDIRDIWLQADGKLAFLCTAQKGLLVVDVSTPGAPKQVAQAVSSLDDAKAPRCHRVWQFGQRIVTVHQGDSEQPGSFFTIYALSGNDTQPKETLAQAAPANTSFYAVAAKGSAFFVAAGDAGVFVYTQAAQALTLAFQGAGLTNARDVAVLGEHLIVADGAEGVQILDATADKLPAKVSALPLVGFAQRLLLAPTGAKRAYVALGAGGVALVNLANISQPSLLGTVKTSFGAMAVALSGGSLLVADGTSVRVHNVKDPQKPLQVGAVAFPSTRQSKVASPRHTAIAAKGDLLFIGEQDDLHISRFTEGSTPILELSHTNIGLGPAKANEKQAFALVIQNRGQASLQITGVAVESATKGVFSVDRTSFVIDPGGFEILEVYAESKEIIPIVGTLRVRSNDPVQPEATVAVTLNPTQISAGALHPTLRWPDVYGRMYTLAELKGKVVLLAYFATW